ncbi:DUF6377 domain-containing protein [Winogradskyella eximia]|uniref:DUF6377 domain-containing protein n=1 Tax=Winogradskyella eximia TaxID=262006 RepID=UPI00248F9E2C|nr:DUF6377 domain-containing protein [Winogradskyella eximia]
MKTLKIIFGIIAVVLFQNNVWAQDLDSLTKVLETKMSNHKVFELQKEERIKNLLAQSNKTNDLKRQYEITNAVFEEYQFYSFNDALQYIEKNIQIAETLNNDLLVNEAILKMGLLLVNTGRFKESIDALSEIDRKTLPESLINNYFIAYEEGYSGLAYNTAVKRSQLNYSELYTAYKDSLYARIKPNTEEALRIKEKEYRDSRNLEMAFTVNTQRLEMVEMGSRGFSLVTFERSLLYQLNNQIAKQKEYLMLSAISDIQAAVKDNASMGTLAKILFIEGDIDRAHQYINFSYDDAEFYNSQLRFVDIANNMPLITKAYEQKSIKQKNKLQKSLIFISILATFLLIAVYLIVKQVKKVSIARNNLKAANEQLKVFNEKLNTSNEDLKRLYFELSEVDKVKEHYIGSFLNLYSEYIDKLDVYRKLVRKYVNANQMNALLKLSKSKQFIDEELEIFNRNFDSSFLHIYPNFLIDVNKLLKPEHQIELKSNDELNTELRILALIKLGINNSSRIAKILRYSVNTIYNYRAAINKSAIDKENFEEMIKSV